jgi:hypothetical protein
MDAGKIKSFIPLPDLRARDAAPGRVTASPADAALADARISLGALLEARIPLRALVGAGIPLSALVDAKIPLSALLDAGIPLGALEDAKIPLRALVDARVPLGALLVGLRGDSDEHLPGVALEPEPLRRDGVVVNLTTHLLLPGRDGRIPGVPLDPNEPDYSHLKPGTAPPAEKPVVQAVAIQRDIDVEVRRAAVFFNPERDAQPAKPEAAVHNTSVLAPVPDPRTEPYLLPQQLMGAVQTASAAEQKQAISALAQARDLERLAGLTVKGEPPTPASDSPLGKLILGAIALGVLLLLFF